MSYFCGSDELEVKRTGPSCGVDQVNRLLAVNLSRHACKELFYVEDNLEDLYVGASEIVVSGVIQGSQSTIQDS